MRNACGSWIIDADPTTSAQTNRYCSGCERRMCYLLDSDAQQLSSSPCPLLKVDKSVDGTNKLVGGKRGGMSRMC